MSYNYPVEHLFNVLHSRAPTKVDALAMSRRTVERGLLSVGLKLHYLGQGNEFDSLVEALGGAEQVLSVNFFRHADASLCLVLPPVGSARAAILLLEALEMFVGIPMFGNKELQIQVCSPGRLSARSCALLAIGFYLGSDTIRTYSVLRELETTFSETTYYPRARRIVLYDARGKFERNFDWWKGVPPQPHIKSRLPFEGGRSDILAGKASPVDIENINLLATLLTHAQQHGYWTTLGRQFIAEMEALLEEHLLLGMLEAPWVRTVDAETQDDTSFFAALQELVAYALQESAYVPAGEHLRFFNFKLPIRKRRQPRRDPNGILEQFRRLLQKYRDEVRKQSFIRTGDIR